MTYGVGWVTWKIRCHGAERPLPLLTNTGKRRTTPTRVDVREGAVVADGSPAETGSTADAAAMVRHALEEDGAR
jgi:hypothetical protein